MQIQLRSGAEFYLDGLLVECILADLRARNLASVAMVCRSLRLPAQAAAYRALQGVVLAQVRPALDADAAEALAAALAPPEKEHG